MDVLTEEHLAVFQAAISDVIEEFKSVSPEQAKPIIDAIPMGRPGEPEEVAVAIVFLSSKEARYITGEEIDVNDWIFFLTRGGVCIMFYIRQNLLYGRNTKK